MAIAATTALVLGGGLLAGGIYASERARKENRRASRVQRRIQNRQAQREKMQQLRQSQRQIASMTNAAAFSGTLGSSGFLGGSAGLLQNAANNAGFIEQVDSAQQSILNRQESANRWSAISQGFKSAANFASMAAAPVPSGG